MRRRGVAVVAAVALIALLNIAVIAAIGATSDEAQSGALRVETTRAFYASESGAVIGVKGVLEGWTPPAVGSVVAIGSSDVEFIEIPPAGIGTLTVEGRAGFARRRVSVELE